MGVGASTATWLGFLSPEDVVRFQEPDELTHRLADGFEADDEAAFVAANRLALEAFRTRDAASAARICHLEIGYAAAGLTTADEPRMALFGLQPVINLIRLHGYAADLSLARTGLAVLEQIADGQPARIFGLDLDDGVLAALGPMHALLRGLARNNCLIETAKIFWRRQQPDEMLAGCRRLLRKWPDVRSTGPFHAAEADWLVGPPDAADAASPAEPVPRRIYLLHILSRATTPLEVSAPGTAELADHLFQTRFEARHKPSLAAARDLACLGDSLLRTGNPGRGRECLQEAYDTACGPDPALANIIRARWLQHAGSAGVVPEPRRADRLGPADLARLTKLAAERLRC